MMNVASLSLCKELYELSIWEDTDFIWYNQVASTAPKSWTTAYAPLDSKEETNYPRPHYPAYSAGYLLRKLPLTTDFPDTWQDKAGMSAPAYLVLVRHIDTMDKYFVAYYQHEDSEHPIEKLKVKDNSPENCLAKLAIELFKTGVLSK